MDDLDKLDKETIQILISKGIIKLEDLKKLKTTTFPEGAVPVLKSLDNYFEYLSKTSSKNTYLGYKRNIMSFIKHIYNDDSLTALSKRTLKEDDLTLKKVSDWFEFQAKGGYDASSIKRNKFAIKSFLTYMHEEYNIPLVDISIIETPTIEVEDINVMKDSEVRDMATYATSLRNKLLILFLYETSMRRQEVIDFKKEDISFIDNLVKIRKPNGDIDRVGYLTYGTKELIVSYIEEWKDEVNDINDKRRAKGNANLLEISEYLFQTIRGYQISYSTIFKALKDTAYEYFLNRAKLEGHSENQSEDIAIEKVKSIDTETLRHSKRVYLFSQGKTVEQVQAIMGDSNQWITKRYLAIAQQLYPENFR